MKHEEELFKKVIEYLDSEEWKYEIVRENASISFGMNLESKLGNCKEYILIAEADIQALAFCPIKASESDRNNVVEYITRANFALKVGKFIFDYDTGEVRYQACLPCKEGTPSVADIKRIVNVPLMMMQHYGDGLVKNLMGFGSPKEDIEALED